MYYSFGHSSGPHSKALINGLWHPHRSLIFAFPFFPFFLSLCKIYFLYLYNTVLVHKNLWIISLDLLLFIEFLHSLFTIFTISPHLLKNPIDKHCKLQP